MLDGEERRRRERRRGARAVNSVGLLRFHVSSRMFLMGNSLVVVLQFVSHMEPVQRYDSSTS